MSIPRDNYVGEPDYPAPWTTKQPREGLRDLDEAKIVSLSPDVCLTPVGSSVVPIPYPIVDYCGHDMGYTPSVFFTGKKAMVMRSCTTHVHGDKPGTKKGVKSGAVEDVCEPIGHADQVRAEGSHVIRHLDRFWMNNRNTQGEAIFVRGTKTFQPPLDDDPVRGSLRWTSGAPIQLAQNTATGTMVDAGGGLFTSQGPSQTFAGQTSGSTLGGAARGTGGVQSPPQTLPTIETPSFPKILSGGLLRRFGIYGLIIEEEMRRASLSEEQRRLEDLSGLIEMSNAGQHVIKADSLLGGRAHNPNPLSIFQSSTWEGKYGVFVQSEEKIPLANDILTRLAGRPMDIRTMSDAEVQGVLAPFQGLSEDEVEQKLKQITEARKKEEEEKKPKPEEPQPIPPPLGNVHIDEDESRKCRLLIICFMPTKPTVDLKEFERQMELQEKGLNAMTPQQMLANRAEYLADPIGMRAKSTPLQEQARQEYRTSPSVRKQYIAKYGPVNGPIELNKYLDSAAALHNPDMVAGGRYDSVVNKTLPIEDRIGGLPENSSMGSQWINPNRNGNTRASRLTEHARKQAQNNCPSVQVDLRMCQSDPSFPGKPVLGT